MLGGPGGLETAGRKDVLTGLTKRVEMEKLISAEIDRHSGFSLLLLRICNLPMIQRQFGSPIRAVKSPTAGPGTAGESDPEN